MKIWSVFSLVIVFHVVVIGLLLIQPGCQSQPTGKPVASETAPPAGGAYSVPAQPAQLDSSFNSGVANTASPTGRTGLTSPTRPQGTTRTTADTSTLTPVLDPVQDELSLPEVQSEYTIKKGDNLTTIAKREGVSLSALLKANGLSKSSTIYVGQKLVIPAGGTTVAPVTSQTVAPSGKQVVVKGGDTLGKIASRAGTTVKILKSLNGLTSDTIYVGQKLQLPEGTSVGTTSPPPQPVATTSTITAGQQTYTVQSGDTPSGIAKKFGVTTSELMAANGISDARKMGIGKVLVIPAGGTVPVSQSVSTAPTLSLPVQPRSENTTTTPVEPVISEPSADDPMSVLEALEDEDIPFSEAEVIDGGTPPGN